MPAALTDAELAHALASLPDWEVREGRLHRELRFGSFAEAWAFMNRVARLAEEADHHPDWSNAYDRVVINLFTHDVGAITEKDTALARRIDGVLPT